MTTANTFANGQTLVSSALQTAQIEGLFQSVLCQILGYMCLQPFLTSIVDNSNQLTLSNVDGLAIGYDITDANVIVGAAGGLIPNNTTITGISGNVITMSNNAVGNLSDVNVYCTAPAANSAVRIAWNTTGAPAWTIGTDVLSIQIVEQDDQYNRIRDRQFTTNDDISVTQNDEYTRCWLVAMVGRGPEAFDRMRLIKSALFQDFTHDILAASQLYLVPNLVAPVRTPELFQGEWWEVTTWSCSFYEQVNETTTIGTVASAEVIVQNNSGVVADFTVTQEG